MMSVENVPSLRREAILPQSDRGRVATLVAMCSLAGVAVGFGLSTAAMQAASDASRAVMVSDVRLTASDVAPPGDDTPWLGIGFHTGTCGGAVVDQVRPGSPAASVGLRPGDLVIGYDHARVNNTADLFHKVRASSIGDRPTIDVLRGNHTLALQPTLAVWPPDLR
jgi:S1-C subfamily serine protease